MTGEVNKQEKKGHRGYIPTTTKSRGTDIVNEMEEQKGGKGDYQTVDRGSSKKNGQKIPKSQDISTSTTEHLV